jgi:hypothetical protein
VKTASATTRFFFLPHLGKTMAELPKDIKNGLSHRGLAAGNAIPVLYTLINIAEKPLKITCFYRSILLYTTPHY